jgi:AraC-like DNA-binding protein
LNKTILDFVIVTSGAIGYFISISLITTSFYKNRANNYLSLSLFLLTSTTLLGWHDPEEGIFGLLHSIMWEFLVAVTLFTYFLVQIQHKHLKKNWYKWLYFPFFSTLIIEVFLHLDFNFNLYNSSFEEEGYVVQLFYSLEDGLSFLYNVVLIFWGRNLIKRSNDISEGKRRWLLKLNLFLICIIAIWLLSNLEDDLFDSEYAINFLWIILSFLSWWILYYGVFKLQIVVQKDEIYQYLTSIGANSAQTKKGINKATTSKIITELYALMDEEKLYKNPLLNRLDLATRLGISEGYLSQVINQEINKSIIQFVNEYRIEAAKELLNNPVFNKYSVEAIGMEAGFKSKSAFYSTFNTNTGISPGAFRKLQKTS